VAHKTEHESFWAGAFGDAYVDRQDSDYIVACNTALFARVLATTRTIGSVIEFGANVGQNLRGLKRLFPAAAMTGVEINRKAFARLAQIEGVTAVNQSILDYEPPSVFDLAFTKTLLIHIDPVQLPRAYDVIFKSSHRYIVLAEYYNPSPVSVPYRGHSERLFKRDFAGEMLDRYPSLELKDYGFAYRRDKFFQDDVNWFLLEKRK
jgi:spore coat polysaccharide biosynthesis protein SpsF